MDYGIFMYSKQMAPLRTVFQSFVPFHPVRQQILFFNVTAKVYTAKNPGLSLGCLSFNAAISTPIFLAGYVQRTSCNSSANSCWICAAAMQYPNTVNWMSVQSVVKFTCLLQVVPSVCNIHMMTLFISQIFIVLLELNPLSPKDIYRRHSEPANLQGYLSEQKMPQLGTRRPITTHNLKKMVRLQHAPPTKCNLGGSGCGLLSMLGSMIFIDHADGLRQAYDIWVFKKTCTLMV